MSNTDIDSLSKKMNELNELIKAFKYEEALDRFYDENIITCENEEAPTIGLATYKERWKLFIENISDYSAELKTTIICNDITVTEWHYKFHNRVFGNWDATQISVQRWKNGKIVHERHYYSR